MTSNATQRVGNAASKAADRVGDMATTGVGAVADAVNAQREQVADAIDTAAEAVGHQGETLPKPLNEYAGEAKDGLGTAADYLRDHDVREMADHVVTSAKDYPIASLLVLGAVVLGGGLLVASMIRNEDDSSSGGQPYFATASNGLGPKATETVTRIRDAAFSMALKKAVDTIEEMFPGFRDHFEKA